MSDTGDARAIEADAAESDATDAQTTDDAEDEQAVDTHLEDVDDGCGCAEVWEHLSDQRED